MQTHDDAPEGYPALARIMGPYPSMAIFKRFVTLNAHSLLMQQAEILLLERELKAMMESDRTDGLTYDEKATDLIGSVENGPNDAQWRLMVEICQKLEDYNRALLRHAKINKLAEPRSYDLEVLREWLKREDGGKNFLSGVERLPWLENGTRDLVALSESQRAPLADWSAEKLVPWTFSKGIQKRGPVAGFNGSVVEWKDQTYQSVTRIIAIMSSALIPSVAIVVLYFIHNMLVRILVSFAFSATFSVAVAVLTSARAAEIFAAMAAFCAVQVVFIGSTSTGS